MATIATTSQIRTLEADYIKHADAHWGQVLMEIAGRGAAKLAYQMYLEYPGNVEIFCGTGNNGGDGLVVARYLKLWDVPVKVFVVKSAKPGKKSASNADLMTSEESKANLRLAELAGVPIHPIEELSVLDLDGAALIVDALLGTGLDRKVEGIYKEIIDGLNASGKRILAIDLPSGINSDNGQIMGSAIKATRTITFGYLKTGHCCHPGVELAGPISLVDIGLPAFDPERRPKIQLTTVSHVRHLIPSRKTDSNKGIYGTILTIAGSLGMSGATMLSAESSLRVGAGLCFLATPKSLVTALPAKEVIYRPLAETDKFSIHPDAIEALDEDLKKATAIVLGPGMSTHPDTVAFVHEFIAETLERISQTPCLIDADALNAISKNKSCVKKGLHKFVLTPHPKELFRLTGKEVKEIQADRINAALQAAEQYGSVVVLKGSFSVVAAPDGRVFINPTGSPAMAKAGAGDVLSGIIGGLLAQSLDLFDAAVAGTYIHGRAGEIAAASLGLAGVLAGDISEAVPDALISIEEGELSGFEKHLSDPEDQVAVQR